MKKVSAMEMRNIEGGGKCPGCGKNCFFGTLLASGEISHLEPGENDQSQPV